LEQRVVERTTELERAHTQLQTILDSMSDGVIGILFDENGNPETRYVNKALTRLVGYTQDEWNGILLRGDHKTEAEAAVFTAQLYEYLRHHPSKRIEAKILRKDGSMFDAEITSTRLDGGGKMIGMVTVMRNISEAKALEDQRARFVANASHELRTPITNLMTRLYLLRKQPERLDDHLEILDSVAGRMRRLVEDLLEISRFERGVIPLNLKPVEVCELVSNVIETQTAEADQKHIRLIHQWSDTPCVVLADADRMTQVITNLVVNAINYTAENGTVNVLVTAENNNQTVVIVVQDTGTGIAPEHLPHIFHAFYRANEGVNGTGLGLSIAKEIVENHGGQISVESQVGVGTRFIVRLAAIPDVASSEIR
jgi:PAS domain S-box-containing protein